MNTEMKWVLVCAALAAGEAAGFALSATQATGVVAAIACLATVLAGWGFSWRAWPYAAAFLAGVSLATFAAGERRSVLDDLVELRGGRPVEALFTVGDDLRTSSPEGGNGYLTCSFDGEVDGVPVRVWMRRDKGEEIPKPGETWMCAGWISRGDGALFGGRRRSFRIGGGLSYARKTSFGPRFADSLVSGVRSGLSERIGLGLSASPEIADLNRAMLLGERHLIGKETRSAFVDAGTVHLFAISGLHVLFLARMLMFLLRLCGVPLRLAGVMMIPLIWCYVAIVGCGASAVRAAVMASMYFLAPVFWRRPNGFTAWALAFLLTYGLRPGMLFDVGCGFSFAVMFSLVAWSWWCAPFGEGMRFARRFGVVFVTWAAGVPLAAHVFGRITPGGLVANFIAVPVAGVSVCAGALGVLASFVSETLGAHVNNFAALSTSLLAGISRAVASTGWSSCAVTPWPAWDCLLWYVSIAAALLLVRSHLLRMRGRI